MEGPFKCYVINTVGGYSGAVEVPGLFLKLSREQLPTQVIKIVHMTWLIMCLLGLESVILPMSWKSRELPRWVLLLPNNAQGFI